MRVEIAKACGWKRCPRCDDPECAYNIPPDYLNDLNACHEMEKVLTDEQYNKFEEILDNLVPSNQRWLCATASQRAEAFLKAIGRWRN